MAVSVRQLLLSVGALAVVAGSASAQTPAIGPRAGQFPDGLVSSISSLTNYGTIGNTTAYAMTTVSCNIGYHDAIWYDDPGTDPYRNQHPVIAQTLYRVKDRRFEQIGNGWLKHGWCAADASNCLNLTNSAAYNALGVQLGVNPVPNFQTRANGSCNWLGLFSTDTYGAGLNADQQDLGPRSEVNAWTGQFGYPYTLNWNLTGNCTYKRVQVSKDDLNPALNAGAKYYGQCVYIFTDEWPGQRYNNATSREFTVGALATGSCNGGGQGYTLSMTGTLRPMVPAIQSYVDFYNNDADPNNNVKLVTADGPNDGRFYITSTVIDNGNGTYTYEYAIYNYNSHRSAMGFSIPKPVSVSASNMGFRSVPYHSGEPYSGDAWTMSVDPTQVRWETQSFGANPNANALRWDSTYNFRFTSASAPVTGNAEIALFRPGAVGDANTVTVVGIDVPGGPPPCPADFNGQDGVTVQDIYDFLAQWNAQNPLADFNGVGGVTVQDIYDFLAAWNDALQNGC